MRLSATLLLGLALSGCGGSSSQPTTQTTPPAVTVSIASSVQTVNAGQATNLTVTTNDPKGVTWSLSGQGSLSGVTSTSVTYTAPTSVPSASCDTLLGFVDAYGGMSARTSAILAYLFTNADSKYEWMCLVV